MVRLLKKVILLIMSIPSDFGHCFVVKKSRMCCKKSNY